MSYQWVRPSSYTLDVASSGECNNPASAYDCDLGTYAYLKEEGSETSYITYYFGTPRQGNQLKIKYKASFDPDGYSSLWARVRVRVDGSWVTLFEDNHLLNTGTYTYSFASGVIDAVEFAVHGYGGMISRTSTFYIYDIQAYMYVNSPPSAPTGLLCDGQTNPAAVDTLTPPFSAIYNDPDSGDIAPYAYVQVASDSGFTNLLWDSGWLSISNVTEGNRCQNITYAGSPLSFDGQDRYWRIRFKDDDGAEGAWSATATFRMKWDATWVKSEGIGVNDGDHLQGERAFSEVASIGDGVARQWQAERAAQEAATVAEALTRGGTRSLQEAVSVVEALARVAEICKSEGIAFSDGDFLEGLHVFSEGIGCSDMIARVWTGTRAFLEGLNADDNVVRAGMRAVQESIGLSDNLFKAVLVILVEALGMADALTRSGDVVAPEIVSVQDDTRRDGARTIADDMAMAGVATAHGQRAFSEAMQVAESLASLIATILRSETLVVSDGDYVDGQHTFVDGIAASDVATTHGQRAFSEALDVADADVKVSALVKALETIAASDQVQRQAEVLIADGLVIAADAMLHGERAIAEAVGVADAEVVEAARAFSESVAAADELVRIKLCKEAVGLADGLYRHLEFNRVGAEGVGVRANVGLKGGSATTKAPYDCRLKVEQLKAELNMEVI